MPMFARYAYAGRTAGQCIQSEAAYRHGSMAWTADHGRFPDVQKKPWSKQSHMDA